ncbi:hypothetical protein NL108_014468, partial [Boleophthalmus pectinirostris]
KHDTCPNTTIHCDGIKDCVFGTDESVCVRFGSGNTLEVRTAEDGRFLPVCASNWKKLYSDQTCAQLGCGRQSSVSRIIGGQVSESGEWPWQVTLHYKGSHVCGGVLISEIFVLTAAHCFPSTDEFSQIATNWAVYAGVVTLDKLPQPHQVAVIILSENYDSNTNDQDIALLKLATPVEFSDTVHPACLPTYDQQWAHGTDCITSGFGTTDAGSSSVSNKLRDVSVKIIDTEVCNTPSSYGGSVTKNMLCAGHLGGGKDSCQ